MDLRRNTLFNAMLYAAALTASILGASAGWPVLLYVSKPLLMLVLSSWFFFNSRRFGDRFTLLVQAGLFFSLAGDVVLLFQHLDRFNFLIGLGAFTMAHICYILAFGHNVADSGQGDGGLLVPMVASVGILAFGFFYAYDLVPLIDEVVLMPVIVHMGTAALMGVAASFRFGRTFPRSFLMVMAGTILLLGAACVLARNAALRPLEHAVWSVPLMYGIGQFLIAAGCLVHVLDPEEIRRKAVLST